MAFSSHPTRNIPEESQARHAYEEGHREPCQPIDRPKVADDGGVARRR